MGRSMRSRGVSSYRSKKRTKRRGNKLSRRISYKRSNRRSNRHLNRRVSKRMRNNRKSFRRRGGAPLKITEAQTAAKIKGETAVKEADAPSAAATDDEAGARNNTLVRLRCLGFQELGTNPKTNEALKGWMGAYRKFYYLIMVVTQESGSDSPKEVYFIRRRWSDIKLFIEELENAIKKRLSRDYKRLYKSAQAKDYSDRIFSLEEENKSQRQGLFDVYLLALSNVNRHDDNKNIGWIVRNWDFFRRDDVEFRGILPHEEIESLNLSESIRLDSFSSLSPENRASELLDLAEGGPRYSIECTGLKSDLVDGQGSKFFYCIVVRERDGSSVTIWRRWSECTDLHKYVLRIHGKIVPTYDVRFFTTKWMNPDKEVANQRRAKLDTYFTQFAKWVNNVYRESKIDLMKNPTGPGESNTVDSNNFVHNFFFRDYPEYDKTSNPMGA